MQVLWLLERLIFFLNLQNPIPIVMNIRLLLLYVAIVLLSACKKNEEPSKILPEAIILPTATTNIDNVLILKLVNDKRIVGCNCGATAMPAVAVLTWNNALAVAASRHSADMNSNGFFSHTSSNGATLSERINLTGYKYSTLGENLANGIFTEQTVVNGWLASEEHCKNIMSANYKEVGVAKVGNYWTQDFGKTP